MVLQRVYSVNHGGNITASIVNIERSAIADKLQPRNINVSFTNNSQVAIDLLVFIFYSDELNINCETGIVTR